MKKQVQVAIKIFGLSLLCSSSVLLFANMAYARDQKVLTSIKALTTEAALTSAKAALAACQKKGAMIAVTVVDRSGQPLVMLRDALAGMHTPDTATRKAWTAVSFKNTTIELAKVTAYNQSNNGIRFLPNVAMIGGGAPILASGSIVGGIGVSGAPGGEMDEDCAKAGIAAIQDALELD